MKKSETITLKDNMSGVHRQLFNLRTKILQRKVSLEDIGDALPIGVCLNNNTKNQYMNQVGEAIFRRDRAELIAMKDSYFEECFYPHHVALMRDQTIAHLPKLLQGHIVSTFVTVKRPDEEDQMCYEALTLLPYKDDCYELIVGTTPQQLGISNRKLNRILEEDELVNKHFNAFRQLTVREQEIISMVVYGRTNPQIAEQLCIARTTVETHRKNINRKLGFSSYFQLVRFAQAFDLV